MTELACLDLQMSVEADGWPAEAVLRRQVSSAVAATFSELGLDPQIRSELSLVFADDTAVKEMNARWRGIDRPTNVLSFPASEPGAKGDLPPMLGDIVLARDTIAREAGVEAKPFDHHLSHLIVHGLLHLLGYDHQSDGEADEMEAIEIRILERLAIPDPYGMMKQND